MSTLPPHTAAQGRDLAMCKALVHAGAELNQPAPAALYFPNHSDFLGGPLESSYVSAHTKMTYSMYAVRYYTRLVVVLM